jgi:hypothetical protein
MNIYLLEGILQGQNDWNRVEIALANYDINSIHVWDVVYIYMSNNWLSLSQREREREPVIALISRRLL